MKITVKLLNSSNQVVSTAVFEAQTRMETPLFKPGIAAMAIYHWIGGNFQDGKSPNGKISLSASSTDDELDITCDVISALSAFGCGSIVICEVDDIDQAFQGEVVSTQTRQLV